jgi:predicted dehydrogenase
VDFGRLAIRPAFRQSPRIVKSDTIRFGVIGLGKRSGLAALAHRPAEGLRVVAGADPHPENLARFQKRYGARTFVTTDYNKLLARAAVDAVFITSPDHCHEQHTVAALRAGKAVYLEKPMAITTKGCDRILKTAAATKSKLYLGHNMRHFPVIRKMKALIDAGAIGEVKAAWCRHFIAYGGDAYFKDWHSERAKVTSLLLQKAAHDLDVLHWLCNGYTKRVAAMGGLTLFGNIRNRRKKSDDGDAAWSENNWPPLSLKGLSPRIDVEDLSAVLMELDNGVFCAYAQCHYTPDAWRNYTIIGTRGRIENFGDMPGNAVVKLWNKRRDRYAAQADEEFVIPEDSGSHGGADPRIVAEFIRYLRDGGKVETSPIAARYAVAAGFAATQSLRNNSQPVKVPPLSKKLATKFSSAGQR